MTLKYRLTNILLLSTVLFISGCGQKGPLYLPEYANKINTSYYLP